MALRSLANLPKVDILGGEGTGVSTVEDEVVVLPDDLETDPEKDAVSIELPDGSVTINLGGIVSQRDEDSSGFDENLAEVLSEGELATISEDLLEAIQSDEDSRREWLDIRAAGIDLLGLKVERPKTDTSTTSAPLEGMSNVQHPLLLESVLRFQANASAELLPADGPVKVRVDDITQDEEEAEEGVAPANPDQPQHAPESSDQEDAEALETDLNHYLTTTASEYYPDTDRMLFFVGFGGTGFKKVYNCPLRRRPVSESVDAKDLVVSNTATDLKNAGRITHIIKMRPSVVKRMQLIGAYRDTPLVEMSTQDTNPVDQKVHDIQGTQDQDQQRPKDIDRVIYETLCELDLVGYEHKDKKGKITGLPLPYKVSIDKEARKVLEIRRNWNEGDEEYPIAKEFYVKFPFVQGLGFYDIGLLHILGNTTVALTAGWREGLDAGMFANFPGFLFAKSSARQNTNEFRIAPGSGVPIETGGQPINQAIMPLPYKEMGAGMMQLLDNMAQTGARVGGTAEINVGEGKQDAPVGTTIALLEQASKVMDSVHKRLTAAQAKEFRLLLERFREDPEAFWRFNRKPATQWDKDRFIKTIENRDIVPAADPNTASHMARVMRAQAAYMMAVQNPDVMDRWKAIEEALWTIKIENPEDYKAPPAGPDPGDMQAQADMAKAQATIISSQAGIKKAEIDLQRTHAIHQKDLVDMQVDNQRQAQELQIKARDSEQKIGIDNKKFEGDMYNKGADREQKDRHFYADKEMQAQEQQVQAQQTQQDMALRQKESEQDMALNVFDKQVEEKNRQEDRQDADKERTEAKTEAKETRKFEQKDRQEERATKKDIASISAKAKAQSAAKKPAPKK